LGGGGAEKHHHSLGGHWGAPSHQGEKIRVELRAKNNNVLREAQEECNESGPKEKNGQAGIGEDNLIKKIPDRPVGGA